MRTKDRCTISKRMRKREIGREWLMELKAGKEGTRKDRLEVTLERCYASFQSPGSPWFTEWEGIRWQGKALKLLDKKYTVYKAFIAHKCFGQDWNPELPKTIVHFLSSVSRFEKKIYTWPPRGNAVGKFMEHLYSTLIFSHCCYWH